MKTEITFWGGLDTIGGNIAEITYGNDRIIFDFGLVYNPASSMLDTDGRHKDTYVLDMLKLGAVPSIDGVYSEKDLTSGPNFLLELPKPQETSDWKTAVFISHLHLDHMGAMDTIAPDIPVYLTDESHRLFSALEKIGEGLTMKREYETVAYGKKIAVGEISVTPYRVDHDVIGAASFLIETPDARVLYSGDLRMHGAHPEYMEAWLTEMKEKDITMLLMEGTSFRPEESEAKEVVPRCQAEKDIKPVATDIMNSTAGLVLFNMYHRNVERIQQFLAAAKAADRIAVLEIETAYLADQFIEDGEFMIYLDQADTQLPEFLKLVDKYGGITAGDVNQKPGGYLLHNSFHHINRLLDLNLKNSVYLHANGMPLGPFDPTYTTLHAILEHFQVDYESLDVSGHATKEDILNLIEQVNPRVLVPWHSKHPELVKPTNEETRVLLPEKCKAYQVEDLAVGIRN